MSNQCNSNKQWSFFIDRGGTFTDIIAITPQGEKCALKLLSENPDQYQDAAIEGIHRLAGIPQTSPTPKDLIAQVRMGTTVATNALLQQKGEPTLLLTSEGLKDCIEIGTQARDDIFALNIKKPKMLYETSVALKERVSSDGTIITPLDEEHARNILQSHYKQGLRAVAILFIHAYQFPAHEKTVAKLAKEIGYTQISTSHEVSPLIKYITRGDTTIVDAYLTPILNNYTTKIASKLDTKRTNTKLWFMTSAGTLTPPDKFRGKDAILSGPAGGIVGAAKTAQTNGFEKIICFDMGGTSTDVALFNGNYDLSLETNIAGHRLQSPMLAIHTVAAGGGSVLTFTNNRMSVGPQSAGANPGPACYRQGGPLTITDANLMTGRLTPRTFPHIFGKHQDQPLDQTIVTKAFESLSKTINQASGQSLSPQAIAQGYIDIANQNMAAAIKKISIERGIDIQDYTLQCYGGAGGQHAAAIAQSLGISKIFIHGLSGVLSAYGMGLATQANRARKRLNRPLKGASLKELSQQAQDLSTKAKKDLSAQDNQTRTTTHCYLAYKGVETKLPILLNKPEQMHQEFEAAHQTHFGFLQQNTPIIIEHMEVEVAQISNEERQHEEQQNFLNSDPQAHLTTPTQIDIFEQDSWHKASLYDERTNLSLQPGATQTGPALLVASNQTVYAPSNWSMTKTPNGHIILERTHKEQTKPNIDTKKADPVRLELFNNLFMSIAEQMGEALRATAQSVNIKERLDFSCAIFDPNGNLIANAPHMPVHLGSMDQAVISIIKANLKTSNKPNITQDDAFMINAPYSGGTHLPDITVITPVFDQDQLIAFVAARGHHADIGGITPGSMSPNATTIHQEGVSFENFHLVKKGRFQEQAVKKLLTDHPYPARNPDQNIADLKAQLAACSKGVKELKTASTQFGTNVVSAYMGFVQTQAETAVKALIKRIATNKLDGLFKGSYQLTTDQGSTIAVTITPDPIKEQLTIDFTGTSAQTNDNFNAPAPITRASVLYVLRTLVAANIPMNAGCLAPITLIIPEKSLLAPQFPAAVVAGNVETSQALTNCLYGAFGCLGLAQGTMNNLTFGNDTLQYYETICSGAPAGPPYNGKQGFDGASAVHTHMTNSRLTDPEILETRYPVLLKDFSIQHGSGGKGKYCAGDGIKRTIVFHAPMQLALLTGYREQAIPGINGGQPGEKGQNLLISQTGQTAKLKSCCEIDIKTGESITIITPTGGGFEKISNHDQ